MAHSTRTGGNQPAGRQDDPNKRVSRRVPGEDMKGGRLGSLFQRIRNPSTRTGVIMLILVILAGTAPFIPTWIQNAQEGLGAREEAQRQFEESLMSEELVIPSQVLPYLNRRVVQMSNADSPAIWNAITFESGPCSEPHFAQIPDSKYKTALQDGCADIQSTQQEYASHCTSEDNCNIPLEARNELLTAMEDMYAQFADSGLVLPYSYEEQVIGP